MIGRLFASAAAVTPVAAAVAEKTESAAVTAPTIWYFFGQPFEVASMAAALFGCFAARFWIGAALALRQQHRWSLDLPVSGMALATSACSMIAMRPGPLGALMVGAGVGIIGEGLFKLAERQARASGAFGPPDKTPD